MKSKSLVRKIKNKLTSKELHNQIKSYEKWIKLQNQDIISRGNYGSVRSAKNDLDLNSVPPINENGSVKKYDFDHINMYSSYRDYVEL